MRAKLRYLYLVVLAFGGAGPTLAQSGMHWQTNLDAARKVAAETNRLILLHFWTDSCGPCMRMEREVFSRPDVAAAIEANFVPVKVNGQHFPMTAREYGVQGYPTDLILTPQGGLVYRRTGGSDATHYVAVLNQVVAGVRNGGYQAYASANANYPSAASAPMAQGGMPLPGAQPAQWPGYPASQAGPTGVSAGAAASSWGAAGAAQPQPAPQAQTIPWQPEAGEWNGGAYAAARGYGPVSEQAGVGSRTPAEQDQSPVPGAANGGYGRAETETDPPAIPGSPSQYGSAGGHYQSVATPAVNPAPLGLDGYCPVSLEEKERWVRGDPRYGVIHRGRTYLFAGPDEADRFYADPDRYAPMMSGMDVVLAVEENRQVPGRREHGAWYERRVYLFATEATFRRFDQAPARYAAAAMQATASTARRPPASPMSPAQPQATPNLGYPPPARY